MATDNPPVALETYKRDDGRIGLRTVDTKRPILGIVDLYVEDELEKVQTVDVTLHTRTDDYDPGHGQSESIEIVNKDGTILWIDVAES